ncbi:fructosamine-3-kinase, putative [Talaromyces stipitatus ATCC 10500]|uniref:protein-ribulosamine 3-kinase n=1 Tax=Talaromyces stipitatus (strain ATCC 10500 / CBS 375.48 / QM 6759 / NRRL 1006) TaxID=441959 RepID=B8MLC0_TALSN|nr:fructosamine-3-kinase, putative [Talaromyces stipitatus ATCC 10500]EED15035.1 fructosamine-3-kinase, putative [Talaromyces stipitatus ATCC 10500]
MAPVPQSILRALGFCSIDPSKATLSTSGLGSGFSNTGRIRISIPREKGEREEERQYFLKTSPDGKEMFQGEFASLNAIADIVPGFCPRALGWGALDEKKGWFLVTEFLDFSGRSSSTTESKGTTSLAQRLGKLHSTPAPPPPSSEDDQSKYGFPVPTYCGNTRQPNNFHNSWAEFYANERLLMILKESERKNGPDAGLRDLVTKTAERVVPRLLGDNHLGYDRNGKGDGIVPVVVHGDLWSGNASRGQIAGSDNSNDGIADVVYDPSACYAHNEYELGIMQMFGGFGRALFDEYHSIVPKTEPVEEYEDRVKLYELYHHLNHHAIFGGGYRSGAVSIMNKLISEYGRG